MPGGDSIAVHIQWERAVRTEDIQKICVLVVEDEPLIRLAAVSTLELSGFEVLDTSNAAEALRILSTSSIAVLFTDIDLNVGMDGLMLAATVRKSWPSVGILATSGRRIPTGTELPSGVRFLGKPYQSETVISLVHELARDAKYN